MSTTETKIENAINELLSLLEQEDVQRDLLLSANEIPVSFVSQAIRVHELMHLLHKLTGKSEEELFRHDRILEHMTDAMQEKYIFIINKYYTF